MCLETQTNANRRAQRQRSANFRLSETGPKTQTNAHKREQKQPNANNAILGGRFEYFFSCPGRGNGESEAPGGGGGIAFFLVKSHGGGSPGREGPGRRGAGNVAAANRGILGGGFFGGAEMSTKNIKELHPLLGTLFCSSPSSSPPQESSLVHWTLVPSVCFFAFPGTIPGSVELLEILSCSYNHLSGAIPEALP